MVQRNRAPRRPVLSTAEVAALHNVDVKTVRRWVASGKLPAYRLPSGELRIYEDDAIRAGRPVVATYTRTRDG
jgi:excisionase family DNA binding protein